MSSTLPDPGLAQSPPVPDTQVPGAGEAFAGAPVLRRPRSRFSLPDWPVLALGLIVLVFLFESLAYREATPPGEGPDEPSHIYVAQYLLREGELPLAPGGDGVGLVQAKHPPLAYLLGAWLARESDLLDYLARSNPEFGWNFAIEMVPNAHLHPPQGYPAYPGTRGVDRLRIVSLIGAILTLIATFAIGRQLAPQRPSVALFATTLVAFNPGFLYGSAVFSNDMFGNAASAWLLWGAILFASGQANPRLQWAVGVMLGLALLSKLTVAAGVLTLGLGVLLGLLRTFRGANDDASVASIENRSPFVRSLVLTATRLGLPALIIAGWWYARNMRLYGWNDPTGYKRFGERAALTIARQVPLREELPIFLRLQFESFFGRFGWLSVSQAEGAYLRMFSLGMLGIFGCLILAWRLRRRGDRESLLRLGLLVFQFGLTYLLIFKQAFTFNLVMSHGRLLYTAITALAVLVAMGLFYGVLGDYWLREETIPGADRWRALALLVLGVATILNAQQARTEVLEPAFEMSEDLDLSEIPFDRYLEQKQFDAAPLIQFGDALVLEAVDIDPNFGKELDPPSTVNMRLIWRKTGELPSRSGKTLHYSAEVEDGPGSKSDGVPHEGKMPFEAWPVGSRFETLHQLDLDHQARPGRSRILISVYHSDTQEVLQARPAEDSISRNIDFMGATSAILNNSVVAVPGPLITPPEFDLGSANIPLKAAFGDSPHTYLSGIDFEEVSTTEMDIVLLWMGPDALEASSSKTKASKNLDWTKNDPAAMSVDRLRLERATVFIHLSDLNGQPLLTADGIPLGGRYPLSEWKPLQRIRDPHRVDLSSLFAQGSDTGRLRADQLELRIGLYDPETGQRWPVSEEGHHVEDHALIINSDQLQPILQNMLKQLEEQE